jgi:hypothetical protein
VKAKAVQYFSDEYLLQCREMSPESIVEFVEGFRELHGNVGRAARSKLISIKIPEDLLAVFRTKAALAGVPYQSQIKLLMKEWIKKDA